jgi:hypothetical protein
LTGATVGARLVLEQLPRVQQLLESSDASVEAIAAVVGLAWPRRYAGISQMRFAHRPLHGGANFAWRQRGGECDGRSRMIALHAVRLEQQAPWETETVIAAAQCMARLVPPSTREALKQRSL